MLEDAKDTVWERLRSPFWGSYALSWCAFNYRIFLHLFDSATAFEKRVAIADLYPCLRAKALAFLFPLFVTILILPLGHWFNWCFAWFVDKLSVKTLERKLILAELGATLSDSRKNAALDAKATHLEDVKRDLEKKARDLDDLAERLSNQAIQVRDSEQRAAQIEARTNQAMKSAKEARTILVDAINDTEKFLSQTEVAAAANAHVYVQRAQKAFQRISSILRTGETHVRDAVGPEDGPGAT